jgi:hypothetical protein
VANIYSIDSSSLVHAWHRAYRPKNFPIIWTRFEDLITEGRLHMSIEVLGELKKKEDELFTWCKERSSGFVIEIDDACQRQVGTLMGTYPRMVDTVKGRSAADPFVIALAMSTNPRKVVVSEENPGKQKIPDVCRAETVDCIKLVDLIERENWLFA